MSEEDTHLVQMLWTDFADEILQHIPKDSQQYKDLRTVFYSGTIGVFLYLKAFGMNKDEPILNVMLAEAMEVVRNSGSGIRQKGANH